LKSEPNQSNFAEKLLSRKDGLPHLLLSDV
jgi:hypothetical protein